ncbi:unnamed protein product [Camellia sinensis]
MEGNATEEVSWVGAGLEPQDQLIHHGSRFSAREETLPLTPPPLPPPPFQRNYQKPFPNFQIRKLSIESSFENCNQFGELETLERRRRRRRCRPTDTLLAIPHHLLKKTPCSLIYCMRLLYLVIGNQQALPGAGYAILAAGSPWIFHPIKAIVSQLLCSCDVVLLIVTGIFQQYLVYQVQKIRLQGYYVFSQKLKHVVRLPFATTAYVLSYKVIAHGTAAMLLVMVWRPHISILSITVLLRSYIHQYNSLDSHPDVLKSLYSPLQPSSSLEGLRYHDGGRLADQQMALLQYQRENLHFLSEEILRLQECLSKYERSNDGSTPQVDLAHLLAARDQELRTLSAEMNQLQSELSLARSLIAERDSEIQRVRTTNNQTRRSVFLKMAFGDGLATHFVGLWLPSGEDNQFYVEENERLRAILGEWSTRAAKLERALEDERMSNLELQKKVLIVRNQPTQESSESAEPT